jgi:3-hydroxyisobutyrate dehydrogenase-like beta-hydroxyacid dehydrogenase
VLPRSFDFGFTLALLHKDVRLGLDQAVVLGLPTPVGSTVDQMLMLAMAIEGADVDITTLVRMLAGPPDATRKWLGRLRRE